MNLRIGWFSTGRDEAARELLKRVHDAVSRGIIRGSMAYVFSNRGPAEDAESDAFFDLVEELGIPLLRRSSRAFCPEGRRKARNDPEGMREWRMAFDREVERTIGEGRADLIVLAGYMLVVGPELCRKHPMINLHPSAPGGPVGTWQEVIWSLIAQEASETGVMMHQVTEELDKGPPVTYCTFPIRGEGFDPLWEDLRKRIRQEGLKKVMEEDGEANPLFRRIRSEGVVREIPLIVETLRAFSEGRIHMGQDGPMDSDGSPLDPICLNEEVERAK